MKIKQKYTKKAYNAVIPASAGIHVCLVVNGFRVKPGMTNIFEDIFFREGLTWI